MAATSSVVVASPRSPQAATARETVRLAVIYILPWFVFIPVAKVPYTPFSTDDLLPLAIIGGGLLVRLWCGGRPRFELVTAGLLLLAFLNFVASVGTAWPASDLIRSAARGGGRFLMDASLVAVMLFCLRDGRDAKRMMQSIVVAAVAQTLFCVWAYTTDYVGPGGIGMAPRPDWSDLRRVHGTFSTEETWIAVSSNFLAAFLMCATLLAIGLADLSRNILGRLSWCASAALCVVGIALSYTRASLAGLGLGVLAYGVLSRRYVVVLALLLVVAASVVTVPGLRNRLASIESDRLALLTAGLNVIGDYPLLGVGEGNFTYVLQTGPRYQYTEYGKAQSTPHVSVLMAAAYAGIAAGLVLVLIWLTLVGRGIAYSALATDPKKRLLLAALTATCVAYLFQDQLNNLIFIPKTRTFLWIFAALIVVAGRTLSSERRLLAQEDP